MIMHVMCRMIESLKFFLSQQRLKHIAIVGPDAMPAMQDKARLLVDISWTSELDRQGGGVQV